MAESAESIVATALDGTGINFYPDVGPQGVTPPYLTYQAVGGQDVNDLGGPADLENARMQVNSWATTRAGAIAAMRTARSALVEAGGLPIGSPVSAYEPDTKLYGSRLDFSLWFKP